MAIKFTVSPTSVPNERNKQLVADGVLEKVGYRKQTIYVLKK